MNINDWAFDILNSPDLEKKLYSPEIIVDNRSCSRSIPRIPARSTSMSFTADKVPFPKKYHLDSDRGISLHFFANHELLAIELMALAILKFQDAPHDFRCGIVHSLKDEQRHFKAYLERMRALSVDFGDVPVNNFFWSSISKMNSPAQYLAAMSLTLEQANLDHTQFYKEAFEEVGDVQTANLLQKIHDDEISHVKFGVYWLNEFRPQKLSFWDEYESLLPDTLTPSRAKGKKLYEQPRLNAGLTVGFIENLKAYSRSKSRLPTVYEFNPACEELLIGAHIQKPKFMNAMEKDLANLLMFVARNGDVVLTPEEPSKGFVNYWVNKGFPGVEFCKSLPQDRKYAQIHPWGRLPSHKEKALGVKPGFEFLYSKEFSARLDHRVRETIESPWISREDYRVVATKKSDVIKFADKLFNSGFHDIVLKSNLGASGRGLKKLRQTDLSSKNFLGWLDNKLEIGPIVVEPWFDRIADFSMQIDLRQGSKEQMVGITRLLTSSSGQYQGHILRGMFSGIEPNVLRKIYEENLLGVMKKVSDIVVENLKSCEFDGIAGIDCFLYEQDNQVYLRPICEINPRITMGYVALELEKYFKHGQPWIWRHSSVKNMNDQKLQHLIARDNENLIPTNDITEKSEFLSWVEPLKTFRASKPKV